jgi:hypothetical protein
VTKIWDAVSGNEVLTLSPPPMPWRPPSTIGTQPVAFSADGHRLIYVVADSVWVGGTKQSKGTISVVTWDATPRNVQARAESK